MKKSLIILSLLTTLGAATAAPVSNTAPASKTLVETVQLDVEGLNCALCSEAMKVKMLSVAGARDIEPRLECGHIYLEVDKGKKPNEAALTFLLTSNGFNLKGVKPSDKSITQIRKTSKDEC